MGDAKVDERTFNGRELDYQIIVRHDEIEVHAPGKSDAIRATEETGLLVYPFGPVAYRMELVDAGRPWFVGSECANCVSIWMAKRRPTFMRDAVMRRNRPRLWWGLVAFVLGILPPPSLFLLSVAAGLLLIQLIAGWNVSGGSWLQAFCFLAVCVGVVWAYDGPLWARVICSFGAALIAVEGVRTALMVRRIAREARRTGALLSPPLAR